MKEFDYDRLFSFSEDQIKQMSEAVTKSKYFSYTQDELQEALWHESLLNTDAIMKTKKKISKILEREEHISEDNKIEIKWLVAYSLRETLENTTAEREMLWATYTHKYETHNEQAQLPKDNYWNKIITCPFSDLIMFKLDQWFDDPYKK